jgi:3'-phosphoadenosine 5'-phosphosulfate sulfotransferase (PAPS reductase)/FAD synthetase
VSGNSRKTHHVLGISGGKDSAALAIYMREKVPEMDYFFADTGAELQETYDYLEKLEAFLGKAIVRLSANRNFDHFLKMHNGFLPSPQARWCTREMKLKPFERWVGDDPTISYIGIRADEHREGYISHKDNIKPVFPFKEAGLVKADIFRILKESGVGIPEYYKWRSRSGCYFCFFQRKNEWVGLKEKHPDLFEKAKTYEKLDPDSGRRYTWSQGESLDELAERANEIKARAEKASKDLVVLPWQERLAMEEDDDPEDQACLICSL